MIAWAVLAALACGSVARTLTLPDSHANATAIVPDFAVPADVRGLQGTSSLDSLNAQPNGGIEIDGWIFDERTHRAGDAMYLDVDGTQRIEGVYGNPRADVARAYASAGLKNVGFHVSVKPGQLTPGEHRLRLGIRIGNERFESVRRFAVLESS
jgi:hypothetical protein